MPWCLGTEAICSQTCKSAIWKSRKRGTNICEVHRHVKFHSKCKVDSSKVKRPEKQLHYESPLHNLSGITPLLRESGWLSRYSDSLRDQWSNPGGGEIFRTYPDRFRVRPSLLYNEYRVFPGGKGDRGVVLTTHPHLVCRGPRKRVKAIPLLSLEACAAYKRVKPRKKKYSTDCLTNRLV